MNKNSWMIWAIAFLAVMNLATLATVIYHRNRYPGIEEVASLPDQAKSDNTSVKYSGRYFRDELGLNNGQMQKFSEFNPGFRRNAMAINRDLDIKRHEMLVEMAEKNCDTNRLNLLSDSIGSLHARLKKLTYRYYIDFKRICNEQQQQKLEQMFNEMFSSDALIGHEGGKGRGGRHFGWRK